uniref:Uncharacterized protein n=1 Tax=Anguilla anguilla TaxID=7936 RepID=A0A0E9P5B0_ANGAN
MRRMRELRSVHSLHRLSVFCLFVLSYVCIVKAHNKACVLLILADCVVCGERSIRTGNR